MVKGLKQYIPIIGLLLIVSLVMAMLLPAGEGVRVSSSNDILSIQAHIALAAETGGTFGNGEPVPQQIEPTFGRGGAPIVSVDYLNGVHIVYNDPLFQEVIYGKAKMKDKAKAKGFDITTVEADIQAEIQHDYFEIWVLLSSFPVDDGVRKGILNDNERIEKYQGKDYLVISLAYFGLHLYNLNFEQGDFITRVNGLDAGKVTGVWW